MQRDRATAPFTILVANLSGQVDAQGNPVKIRTGFTHQHIMGDRCAHVMRGLVVGGDTPTPATATVTVIDNDFSTGYATLYLGDYELVGGVHYPIGADVTITATNMALAISNLPEFSASAVGAVVTINGPDGLAGSDIRLEALFEGTKTNFTLNPTTGSLIPGTPRIGTPAVLP